MGLPIDTLAGILGQRSAARAAVLSTVFATSSGGSITVPAGAQGVIAFAVQYKGASSTLSTISLQDAGSFTISRNLPETFDLMGTSLSYATTSTSGSKTLSFTFTDSTYDYGPLVCLVFVNGINTSNWIRETNADQRQQSTNVSKTVASSTSDLVVAFHGRGFNAPSTIAGWTSQGSTTAFNKQAARVSTANSPGASTTTFIGTDTAFYDVLGLVSIKAAA